MLVSLHVSNIAVIKSAEVEFSRGFTALTGETGAGKSVLMGCLSLLAGGRADKELLRTGEERGEVSALFSAISAVALAKLAALDIAPDEEGNLLLSRVIHGDGRSASRVNGKPVSLGVLRETAAALFFVHGQNAGRELSDAVGERALLDGSALDQEHLAAYKEAFAAFTAARKALAACMAEQDEKERMQEILRYQLEDIEQISPEVGEDEALLDQKLLLKNAGKIHKQASFAYRALRGAEKGNAAYIIERAESALRSISDMAPEAGEVADALAECSSALEDAAERLRGLISLGEEDPEEALDRIEGRLAAIEKLCRKYGGSIPAVLAFAEKTKNTLERYENAEVEIAEGKKRLALAEAECLRLAKILHQKRVEAAEKISQAVTETLHFLDMPKAEFSISVVAKQEGKKPVLDEHGMDDIAFLLSANAGEPALPIAKAASGGELARIMLSIRKHLSAGDDIDTVVYDEVDTGVSGKTARKIGFLLRETAAACQILCITHSAQIASLAEAHLLVRKAEENGRVESSVFALDREGRIAELSRILGGIRITEAQRLAAIDMLSGKE